MANFVRLDENDIVIRGEAIKNEVVAGPGGQTGEETRGIAHLQSLYGPESIWVQTSYNGNFRKQYGGIGYRYDRLADVFVAPRPFPSWTLDENHDWQPPVPMPEGSSWIWDEDAQAWVLP